MNGVGEVTDRFRIEFEALVPRALQCAYDYVDHDERIDTIWIVGHRDGDWATGNVFYNVSGTVGRPGRLSHVLPELDDSPDRQDSLDPAVRGVTRLLGGGNRNENPTRLVVRYDVAAQAMTADFFYEPLRMGPEDTLRHVADSWFNRLVATGNDSAAD